MRIVSWNVNGIRAVAGRGDLQWLWTSDADVVCLQETKIQADAVTDELRAPAGWRSWWSHGVRKGYSGTAIFVRDDVTATPFPLSVGGEDHPEFDCEGRVVGVDLGAFVLFGVYFPNGGSSDARLQFKHAWHDRFLDAIVALNKTRPVVVGGDFNVAHRPLDVALPEQWAHVSGFLPPERAWFDRMLASGFVDTFRFLKGDLPRQYTWWETRVNARKDNLGWRIDTFVASRDLEEKLVDAWISPHIRGSDHCPVGVEIEVPLRRAWKAPADDVDESTADAIDDELASDDDSDASDDDSRWRR